MRDNQCHAGPASRRGLRLAASSILTLSLSLCLSVQAQTASVANGRAIFNSRCAACHSLDTNRVGPALGTVWGRVAGKAPGFEYSKALGQATHVWRREALLAWLENPESVVPGQEMGYRLDLAADRSDVVAFLASLADTKPGN